MRKILIPLPTNLRKLLSAKYKCLRISQSALKKRMKPALAMALLVVLVFMPAFRFQDKDDRLSRIELAQMLETVLESCRVSAQPDTLPEYSDLADEELFAVYRTLSCNLMRGYPDNSFKPHEYLRNIETLGYIQKLMVFLRQVKPKSQAGQRLARVMAYQDTPGEIMAGTLSSFIPEQLGASSAFTDKEVVADLILSVIDQHRESRLNGRVVSALSGEPLARAYVASEKMAVMTDANGCFTINYPAENLAEVVVMAAAENFQPVEIKRNIKFSRDLILRLKPQKTAD